MFSTHGQEGDLGRGGGGGGADTRRIIMPCCHGEGALLSLHGIFLIFGELVDAPHVSFQADWRA